MIRSRENRLLAVALCGALPGVLVSLCLLWLHPASPAVRWTLAAAVLSAAAGCALLLRALAVRPVQTLSNMLAAIREGDYTLRGSEAFATDSFGLALREANAIAEALRGQRLDSLEASALLGTVMDEIEVAVFAFDPGGALRFVNRAGAQLLQKPAESLVGRGAAQLGLAAALASERAQTMDLFIGRFDVRVRSVRLAGVAHRLLVLSDLRRALRDEERTAWQRLIRVLSHEINNSLTPIQSIAQSLQSSGAPPEDVRAGLALIASRAQAVSRFMASYARLARLPPPRLAQLSIAALVERAAALEPRVRVERGPEATVQGDADQLEQALINLVTNAFEAGAGDVRVGWTAAADAVEVTVCDDGPGLPESANLFTPFFTTRKEGSGIGLVLSRQIAENHGGGLTLQNRRDAQGAVATIRLPR